MESLLAALIAFQLIQGVQGYEAVIAVYNSDGELNNCSYGANYIYNINDLSTERLKSNTLLKFCSDTITLKKRLSISSVSSLTLIGFAHNTTVNCINRSGEVGIVLKYIQSLKLCTITIENCGVYVMTTVDPRLEHLNIIASVIIENSTDITIAGLTIRKSPGTGLAMFHNNGSIHIMDTNFEGNGYDKHPGGNGVYIESGLTVCNTSYHFDSCQFLHNAATTGLDTKFLGFTRFDKGGGMCIYILESKHISINISNSMFVGNGADHYGGALHITFHDKSVNNSARVSHSQFINNTAQYGGATYSGCVHNWHPKPVTPKDCYHSFESVHFVGNWAEFGGGSSIFSDSLANADGEVYFTNCTWTKNSGQYGAAIAILPNAWNLYTNTRGYLPILKFVNCNITENSVKPHTIHEIGEYSEFSDGSGALYCFNHQVEFEGMSVFKGNNGTALYLDSCASIFAKSSLTYFTNNSGYQGGAIHQLSSIIFIDDDARIHFTANTAKDKGGALYEHTTTRLASGYSRTCFLQYYGVNKTITERNISVNFVNNTASHYGHSIYASTLVPCYKRYALNISHKIFNSVGDFTYHSEDRDRDFATAVNHTSIVKEKWSGRILATPGNETKLPFNNTDDFGQPVETNYLVTIQDNADICTSNRYVSNYILLLKGKINTTTTVTLTDVSARHNSLKFKVTTLACPPGFTHDSRLQVCTCAFSTVKQYIGIGRCNLTISRAYRIEGYWVGYVIEYKGEEDEHFLVSGVCPRGFCSFHDHDQNLLPDRADRNKLDQLVCSKSRTGILCGQCKQNFSVHFHSLDFECKPNKFCSLGWLFYILSEIIPVTVIFMIIIVFNIPFTSGMVNGFIFYCQVVEVVKFQSMKLTTHSRPTQIVHKITSLIYLIFSLDIFVYNELSFCLWESAKAVNVQAFKFVTLLYTLFLVFLITFTAKYCLCLRCRQAPLSRYLKIKDGIIHGLSTFLILCYAQCTRSSLMLLTSATLYHQGPTKYKTMVYYDGEVEWMGTHHLLYAIPAILLTIFIVILPPLLLLVYPIHNKVLTFLRIDEAKCTQIVFGPLNRLKPFFDSFQSCFKDEFRFFSGLYFVYRFFIMFNVLIYYFQDSFFYLEIQLVMMVIIHADRHLTFW